MLVPADLRAQLGDAGGRIGASSDPQQDRGELLRASRRRRRAPASASTSAVATPHVTPTAPQPAATRGLRCRTARRRRRRRRPARRRAAAIARQHRLGIAACGWTESSTVTIAWNGRPAAGSRTRGRPRRATSRWRRRSRRRPRRGARARSSTPSNRPSRRGRVGVVPHPVGVEQLLRPRARRTPASGRSAAGRCRTAARRRRSRGRAPSVTAWRCDATISGMVSIEGAVEVEHDGLPAELGHLGTVATKAAMASRATVAVRTAPARPRRGRRS